MKCNPRTLEENVKSSCFESTNTAAFALGFASIEYSVDDLSKPMSRDLDSITLSGGL